MPLHPCIGFVINVFRSPFLGSVLPPRQQLKTPMQKMRPLHWAPLNMNTVSELTLFYHNLNCACYQVLLSVHGLWSLLKYLFSIHMVYSIETVPPSLYTWYSIISHPLSLRWPLLAGWILYRQTKPTVWTCKIWRDYSARRVKVMETRSRSLHRVGALYSSFAQHVE